VRPQLAADAADRHVEATVFGTRLPPKHLLKERPTVDCLTRALQEPGEQFQLRGGEMHIPAREGDTLATPVNRDVAHGDDALGRITIFE
jgi:hypothetical protein